MLSRSRLTKPTVAIALLALLVGALPGVDAVAHDAEPDPPEPLDELSGDDRPAPAPDPPVHVQPIGAGGEPLEGSAPSSPTPTAVHVQPVDGSGGALPVGHDVPPTSPDTAMSTRALIDDEGALPVAGPGLLAAPSSAGPGPGDPVAVDDLYGVANDAVLSVAAPGFLGNDIDLDGEAITAVALLDNPDNGSLTAFPNGSFTYTPNAGFVGVDSFVYRMRDASNNFDEATVTIEVLPAANRAPIAADDLFTMPAGTTLSIAAPGFLANDIDLDGEAITAVALLDNPDDGVLTAFPNGSFTYTPNAGFTGVDSFEYRMRDASNNFAEATVTIEVFAANRPPIALNDAYAVVAGTTLSIAAPGFLGNDVDVDGDAITAVALLDNPDNGVLTAFPNGSFTYTPNAGFAGVDSFEYRMRDTSNNFDEAIVTIEVFGGNQPPVAGNDTYAATEDVVLVIAAPGVLGNDSDINGDALVVVGNTSPNHGTMSQAADGGFTYTPDPDFCGTDSYDYTASDPLGLTDEATVTIEVACVNDAPVAIDDAYTTTENVALVVPADDGVLLHGVDDFDVDGDSISVVAFDATTAFGGTVAMNTDGSFAYTPAADFAGFDAFTYTISDGNGGSDTGTVTVEVTAVHNRSIAVSVSNWRRAGAAFAGAITIDNKTSRGYPVQIVDMAVEVEYRSPGDRTWTPVAVTPGSCTYAPAPPFVVVNRVTVEVSACTLTAPVPSSASVRVTGAARAFGHFRGNRPADGWFSARMAI